MFNLECHLLTSGLRSASLNSLIVASHAAKSPAVKTGRSVLTSLSKQVELAYKTT